MVRIPRTDDKKRLKIYQIQPDRHKIIFTWIFFVSVHPRIIRIVSIEKEVA